MTEKFQKQVEHEKNFINKLNIEHKSKFHKQIENKK